MTRIKLIGMILAFVTTVTAHRVNGQTPMGTTFTYQGHLTSAGDPVDGTCDFVFTLWDGPTTIGATQIGPTLAFDGSAGGAPPVQVVDGRQQCR